MGVGVAVGAGVGVGVAGRRPTENVRVVAAPTIARGVDRADREYVLAGSEARRGVR